MMPFLFATLNFTSINAISFGKFTSFYRSGTLSHFKLMNEQLAFNRIKIAELDLVLTECILIQTHRVANVIIFATTWCLSPIFATTCA